jgi:hypothetical protein
MNSLDAVVRKVGAGIVHLLVDYGRGAAPWHLTFQRRG